MKSIAFIPARAGSKGVPGKNIKSLCGKPLITYTLACALESQVDQVVVSTDREEIFNVCKDFAFKYFPAQLDTLCFHDRPDSLSGDTAQIKCAVRHCFSTMQTDESTKVIILQPTSPIRSALHINEVISLLEKGAKSVISVSEPSQKPQEMLIKRQAGYAWLMGSPVGKQRQEYEDIIYINGSIYGYQLNDYLSKEQISLEETFFYKMEDRFGIDIDTPMDFLITESLLSKQKVAIQ